MSTFITVDNDHPLCLPAEADACLLATPDSALRSLWIGQCFRQKMPFILPTLEGLSAAELQHLASTSAKKKVPVAILGSYRLFPAFARLKELINSGCIGEVLSITATASPSLQPLLVKDLVNWLAPQAASNATFPSTGTTDALTLSLSAPLGEVTATTDVQSFSGDITVTLRHLPTRRIHCAPASPRQAEMHILLHTSPFKHRWPLLMHATDLLFQEKSPSKPCSNSSNKESN